LPLHNPRQGTRRPALGTDHAENAADDIHLRLVNLVSIPGGVEPEPEAWHARGDYLSFARLPQFAPSAPLRDLEALEARDLIEYPVGELAFRTLVPAVVERPEGRAAILGQHNRHAAARHEVTHTIHAGPLKACAALSGV
jgi:hypothetical protein